MLRIIPLGGLGEFGLNAMVLEYGDERILIDCGLMFPSNEMPGVGVIWPDLSYLQDAPERLKGIVLTHGHEDHVGALSSVLAQARVPVYGFPFTLGVARSRVEESGLTPELRDVAPRESIRLSDAFSVEFVRVVHSMPDASALVIRTPEGVVVHTGDFKLDEDPIDGRPTDLDRLREISEAEGILCLLSDSTGSEGERPTGSEREVERTFARLFEEAEGRIIVSTFASNVLRLRHTLELCARIGRKVVLAGRTLSRNVDLARALKLMKLPDDLIIPAEDAVSLPRNKVCILATGSQAEPRSALVQMAQGTWQARSGGFGQTTPSGHTHGAHAVAHEETTAPGAPVVAGPTLGIQAGDMVIISSRAIPGNERLVGDLIDRLLERGARVVYGGSTPGVHVSGHASQPQQRQMLDAVQPRHFVPIHGELKQLYGHLNVARTAGLTPDQLLLARDGDVLSFQEGHGRHGGEVRVGRIYRDRWGSGALDPETLTEREKLAELGVLCAAVVVDAGRRQIVSGPHFTHRGLSREEIGALGHVAQDAREALASLSPSLLGDEAFVREELSRSVRRALRQRTGKRSAVLPMVVKL